MSAGSPAALRRAVGYGLLARTWSLASTPLTLYLIAARLTPEAQGYYYTMAGLMALQVFFELGLATVLVQFFSHEFVALRWAAHGRITGDRLAHARLKSLLAKAALWFGAASALLAIVLVALGLSYFRAAEGGLAGWQLPWVLAVAGVAANLALSPLVALESGSGHVTEMARCEAQAALLGTLSLWACLLAGVGLYGLGASLLLKFLVYARYFVRRRPVLLRGMARLPRRAVEGASWWRDVWPLQWRISLSWMAGYVVFHLFTPVLFYYRGAAEAGRMGITIAAANALTAIALTFVNANVPQFGRLVAQAEWQALDRQFFRVLRQGAALALAGALAGTVAVAILQGGFAIGARFLPWTQVALLLTGAGLQVLMSHFAIYLRAFKREPLVALAVFHGLLQGGATWWIGRSHGAAGIALSVLLINLAMLPLTLLVWRRCRARWQRPAP